MSQFENTVKKLAASPMKCALLPLIPGALQKEGSITEHLFGGAKDATGAQSIARGVAQSLGQAAAVGGGSYLVGKLLDKYDDSADRLSAERSQVGRMSGEQAFRQKMLGKLHPMHQRVYKEVMVDPVIAKADPNLINSSYETMKRFAPHLATDANAARSFLRENAIYGTGPSYASLKNLADAESSVGRASGFGG